MSNNVLAHVAFVQAIYVQGLNSQYNIVAEIRLDRRGEFYLCERYLWRYHSMLKMVELTA